MNARSAMSRCALLCLVAGFPLALAATDWSRFRGPNGSGVLRYVIGVVWPFEAWDYEFQT